MWSSVFRLRFRFSIWSSFCSVWLSRWQTLLFSVEGTGWQWTGPTLHLHSPLRILLIMTNTTFGTLCWSCSFTCICWRTRGAYFDEAELERIALSYHFALDVLCDKAEVHCPGTIALGAGLRRLFIVTVTTQALLGTRVHGRTTINKRWSRTQSVASSSKRTSTVTIAIKAIVQDWHHCRNNS